MPGRSVCPTAIACSCHFRGHIRRQHSICPRSIVVM